MKTKSILTLLIVAFTALSCFEKDDDDTTNDNLLIGKWKFEQVITYDNGVIIEEQYFTECATEEEYQENGQLIIQRYILNNEGCTSVEIITATYTLNNTTLIVDYGGGDIEEAEITTLNESTLIFETSDTFEGKTFIDVIQLKKL